MMENKQLMTVGAVLLVLVIGAVVFFAQKSQDKGLIGEAFYLPQKADSLYKKETISKRTAQPVVPSKEVLGCTDSDFDPQTGGLDADEAGIVSYTWEEKYVSPKVKFDEKGKPVSLSYSEVITDVREDFCVLHGGQSSVGEAYCKLGVAEVQTMKCGELETCTYGIIQSGVHSGKSAAYCAPKCRLYFDDEGIYEDIFKPKTKPNVKVKEGIMDIDYGVKVDTCMDKHTLREWFCQNDLRAVPYDYSCKSDEICDDGVCRPPRCVDSDKLKTEPAKEGSIFTGGYTTATGTKTVDKCSPDKKSVQEAWCDGDTPMVSVIACPDSSYGVKGECTELGGMGSCYAYN